MSDLQRHFSGNGDIEMVNTKVVELNEQKSSEQVKSRAVVRYYIDELGFYRHLDPEQKHYVCSNINAVNLKASKNSNARLASGDGGYEICLRAIRGDLGISNFDRADGYADWKRSWNEFMRDKLINQQPITLNRELKMRVRSGIPHDYRCKVWTALIRMRTKAIRQQVGDDIYERLLRDQVAKLEIPDCNHNINSILESSIDVTNIPNETSRKEDLLAGNLPRDWDKMDKCFRQIELDLLRTLPNNRHFEDPNSRGIQRVRRVLRAYACFNPTVGYCQGMNRLAAMALLVLPEEEAFWCMVAITQCIMPKDYYLKPWLAQVDCCVLSDLLEKKMPKLHKHLVKNDIQLTLFTWFFTIFVDGFRPELMLRIWDCFLLEGDKVLFRFALAILYISQNDLLEMNDFSSMSTHLSRLVSTRRLDVEHLFESKY